jgi:hypothetical protein
VLGPWLFRIPDDFNHLGEGITVLTDEQLGRLRHCADGNTLRYEPPEIVAALVAGGYAKEGIGRVVTVTPKGHQYLRARSTTRR